MHVKSFDYAIKLVCSGVSKIQTQTFYQYVFYMRVCINIMMFALCESAISAINLNLIKVRNENF